MIVFFLYVSYFLTTYCSLYLSMANNRRGYWARWMTMTLMRRTHTETVWFIRPRRIRAMWSQITIFEILITRCITRKQSRHNRGTSALEVCTYAWNLYTLREIVANQTKKNQLYLAEKKKKSVSEKEERGRSERRPKAWNKEKDIDNYSEHKPTHKCQEERVEDTPDTQQNERRKV